MKKLLLILLLVCPSILYSQDFKTFYWGDSSLKVKSTEKAKLIMDGGDQLLEYESEISTLKPTLTYYFVNDKLSGVLYSFKEIHSNKNLYIVDYEKTKELLIEKYGNPSKTQEEWQSDLFKGDKQYYGLAISKGDLEMSVLWMSNRTNLICRISGDNGKIVHGIYYSSKIITKNGIDKKEDLNKL